MHKHILPLLVITLLSVVVWLFAEVESLGEDRLNAPMRFEPVGDPPETLVDVQEFDGRIELVVRGSRGAIQRARAALEQPIVLRPGDTGVPDVDGTHTVRLKEALGNYEPLVGTGVVIESMRPQSVRITVSELIVQEVDIVPDLTGIVTEGDATVQPQRARIRVPRSLAPSLEGVSVIARVDPGSITNPQPGPRTRSVTLQLPGAVAGKRGVSLLTERATVAFSLRSTIETRTFTSVPVQLLGTSTGFREWSIQIDQQQQLIDLELRGPSEALDQLSADGARLVAVLSLSDLELSRGVTEKPVRLFVLREDVPAPLPEGVEPTGILPSVGFSAERLETESDE